MEEKQPTLARATCLLATCIRLIDGDTVEACIELGLGITVNRPCRIKDYDAPEITGPTRTAGLKAKDYLSEILRPGDKFWITQPPDRLDCYGRVLGHWWTFDGRKIRDLLPSEYRRN